MKVTMVKRIRLSVLLVTCGFSSSQSLTASQSSSFIAWLCRKLKIDPGVYARVTRDIPKVRPGDQIVSFDKMTGAETTIWICGGCWYSNSFGFEKHCRHKKRWYLDVHHRPARFRSGKFLMQRRFNGFFGP